MTTRLNIFTGKALSLITLQVKRVVRVFVLLVIITTTSTPSTISAANFLGEFAGTASQNQMHCTYVVRYGDTLFGIATRFGVSTYNLASINGIYNPHWIFAGTILRVPCGGFFPPPLPPTGICAYYTVRHGDWLMAIAVRHGVSWQSIWYANHLANPNLIYPGMTLAIPCGGRPNPPTPTPAESLTQLIIKVKANGQVDNLDARLRSAGLVPEGKSVLNLIAPERTAAWTNKSACAQSSAEPYQVLVAPIITETVGISSTNVLVGVIAMPACRIAKVLDKGFELQPVDGAVIYALVVRDAPIVGKQLSTSQYPVTQGIAKSETPIRLELMLSGADVPLINGRSVPVVPPPTYPPQPRKPTIQLGSITIQWDGFTWMFP